MTPDHDTDQYILSTGRRIYANNLIIGLSPNIVAFQGYDGSFGPDFEPRLTTEERKEIAIFMMHLWAKWGSK